MENELQQNLDEILLDKETNLLSENLKEGVTVLGVTGTLETLDTSDATAQASDIVEGKTAYVNGEKITGSFASDENLDVSSTVSQQSDVTIGDDGFGSQSLIFKGAQSGYYTPKYIKMLHLQFQLNKVL